MFSFLPFQLTCAMQSKKAASSRPLSVLASRALKTVGIVVLIGALLDIFILPIPYQLDRQWQIDFVTQAADRGISLLVGIVLFLTGYWVDGAAGLASEKKSIWQDGRFYAFILASILGLFFLLLFPFHLNNVRLGHEEAQTQIAAQVKTAETNLNTQIQTEMDSRRQQIQQLLPATDEQLSELTKNNQLTKEQADLIRKFKANPSEVDTFLKKQEDDLRSKLKGEIGTQQQQAQEKVKQEALKSGLRVGVTNLILAIGFITIGWLGLRNVRQL